jgi:enoyl-CoA hydratase/carnithine racemase
MPSETGYVAVRRQGVAAIVELQRPEKLNALNRGVVEELTAALDALDEDADVLGVVITGAGRAFSAGGDLNEALEQTTVGDSLRFLKRIRRLTATIEMSSKPIVAAINGFCYTGGLELAMACDRRIAAPEATFSISSARMGSVAGLGGTQRLPRLVGITAAKDLLMSARVFTAQEAFTMGVVDEIAEDQISVDAAVAWIDQLRGSAPLAIWLAKLAVNLGVEMDLASSLQLEGLMTALAFTTEDRREGMSAILEKRPAVFSGR